MLRVRHQPHDIALLADDAGDVVLRAVEVVAGRVAEHDLVGIDVAEEAAGHVLGRDRQALARVAGRRERRVGALHRDVDLAADEPQADVRQQRAGQQAGLAEDLEAVADAEHRAAVARERHDRLHDRREPGDGAGAQVVAVGESAGDDDAVDAVQVGVAVPQWHDVGHAARRQAGVDVVTGAGEGDDAELHDSVAGSTAWIS
jgi:hypothetical protein